MKPKYFVLENVNSMPRAAKDEISDALGIQPVMINAALVSAQNRKRLFWVGKWNGKKYEQVEIKQPEDKGILLKDILESGDVDRLKSYCIDANYYKGANWKQYIEKGRRQLVRIGSLNSGGQGDRIYSIDGKSVGLSALGGGRGAKTGLYFVSALTETRTEESKQIRRENYKKLGKDYSPRRGKELIPRKDGKANTVTTFQTKESLLLVVPEATKKGYAIAKEGDSVDLSFPTSKTRRGRVCNKVKNLMTSQNIGVFTDGYIRKLTPIECERLQGVPDGYTDGTSNTQRYKALGNAFNADVVAHILKQIMGPRRRE